MGLYGILSERFDPPVIALAFRVNPCRGLGVWVPKGAFDLPQWLPTSEGFQSTLAGSASLPALGRPAAGSILGEAGAGKASVCATIMLFRGFARSLKCIIVR